jgi:Rad3-related DNA helicase
MLVVAPSYKVMNNIERCMQFNPDLRKHLNSVKKVFTETRDNFDDIVKKFKTAAVEKRGALLFCVCRGKVS